MKTLRKLFAPTAFVAALGLTGCGGGSDSVRTEVPNSAGVSTAAFVNFIQSLSANDESSEPLTLKDTFAVPADETAEPTPLT